MKEYIFSVNPNSVRGIVTALKKELPFIGRVDILNRQSKSVLKIQVPRSKKEDAALEELQLVVEEKKIRRIVDRLDRAEDYDCIAYMYKRGDL